MSVTLTQLLAMAGGVVLAGVIAHGAWTARRAGPKRALPPRQEEPHFDTPPLGADVAMEDEPLDVALPAVAWPLRRASARIDALIDAIAAVTVESPVSGELALQHLPGSRRAGTKPLQIEGLNAATGEWELPAPGQRYSEFQAGVKMASRSGPLNEIEYSEFVQKLQAFADTIGAMADLPDMLEVVRRARELDAFAGEHDAQLSIGLRANAAAWTIGFLQQAAGRHGFLPGAMPGRLVLPATEEGAPPVLVLSFDAQAALAEDPNQASVREVQLTLDVPQTPEVAEPYPAWQDIARRLAADLDAAMVDGGGRPILLQSFVSIGEDLARLYAVLAEHELSAGSPAARRLFS